MSKPMLEKFAPGCSDERGRQLQQIVDTLRQAPGNDRYLVDRCPDDDSRWSQSTHWLSEAAMQAHFEAPEVQGLIGQLDSRLANSLDVSGFPLV